MKVCGIVEDALREHYHVNLNSIVHAEWKLNRFFNTHVYNIPSEENEGRPDYLFPISSITEPNRPTSGINKAIVGQSTVGRSYNVMVPRNRFYVADESDLYKYWISPVPSGESGAFPIFNEENFPEPDGETYEYDDETCVRPAVRYLNRFDEQILILTNKITFTVENSYAEPVDYDVQIRSIVDGDWETIISNVFIPDNGKVELYYDGDEWSTEEYFDADMYLSEVRLVVREMDKSAYLSLIELGACLERDVSHLVVSWDNNMSMGEPDFITPLGNISANTGSITLWNEELNPFQNYNQDGEYFNLLDRGVKFRCWTVLNDVPLPEFTMYSDVWDEQDDVTVVSLMDESEVLMQTKPRAVLYRNISVQEAVWRICDIIGFTNYTLDALDKNTKIDVFYTDGEQTAWEVFADLARGTQTAIFFGYDGVLHIVTRDKAWDGEKPYVYSFEVDPADRPADIETFKESTDYMANKVTVNWEPTKFSERRDNITPYEVVWEPEDAVVLRATPLAKPLLIDDTSIFLETKNGVTWPFSGLMNIEGEVIAYDAKKYVYRDAANVRQTNWIESLEEQRAIDDRTGSFYRHMNSYTGELRISERGVWATEARDHLIDLTGWNTTVRRNYTTNKSANRAVLKPSKSMLTIESPSNVQMNDYTYFHRGNSLDEGYKYLGTRIKIDKGSHAHKTAGIFFNADNGVGSGYFVEIMATSRMNGGMRQKRNELVFYSQKANGDKKRLGGDFVEVVKNKGKGKTKTTTKTKTMVGQRLAVPAERWIDLDVWFKTHEDVHIIQIFANGRFMFEARVTGEWKHSKVSRFGLFTRGKSKASFDYIYGINSPGVEKIDSESYWDRIEGGWYSTQASDWTFGTREVWSKDNKPGKKPWVPKKLTQRYKQRLFSEFGPVAHEIRLFDVKFTNELPVLESRIYLSNTSQVVCTEYTGGIKNATFILANISRQNAIISGEDDATTLGNGTINQKLFVYGRPVIREDSNSISKDDEWAIRRRGPIEMEYATPWIQNRDAADGFADWLVSHWTESDTTAEMVVFGNPLIELTDVVRVVSETHIALYYVVGISNTYDAGLSTTLQLRKAKGWIAE